MAALIAFSVLLLIYITTSCVSIRAAIYGYRQCGNSLLASHLLFLMLTVLVSFFAPVTKHLLTDHGYLTLFLLGFNEEMMKGISLLLFCGSWLKRAQMSKQLIQPAIWSLALLIALLETTQLLAEPLLSSFFYLSDPMVMSEGDYKLPVVQYFSTTGLYFLSSAVITRIAIHFFLCWLYVWYWTGGQKQWALMVAVVHGVINVVMLQIALNTPTPAMHIMLMGCAYMLIGGLLGIWVVSLRKKSKQLSNFVKHPAQVLKYCPEKGE
ncbi:hypothetical protein [Alteromonas sp. CYL-A6]|uniref:hypothetical protein n=1 Tax=Alteromonas nitratireducens TaxID=3390813 RepID=UPI0034B8BB2C